MRGNETDSTFTELEACKSLAEDRSFFHFPQAEDDFPPQLLNFFVNEALVFGSVAFLITLHLDIILNSIPHIIFIEHGSIDVRNQVVLLLLLDVLDDFLLLDDLLLAEFPLLLEFGCLSVVPDDVES